MLLTATPIINLKKESGAAVVWNFLAISAAILAISRDKMRCRGLHGHVTQEHLKYLLFWHCFCCWPVFLWRQCYRYLVLSNCMLKMLARIWWDLRKNFGSHFQKSVKMKIWCCESRKLLDWVCFLIAYVKRLDIVTICKHVFHAFIAWWKPRRCFGEIESRYVIITNIASN